jgi:spore coat protein U-like protein
MNGRLGRAIALLLLLSQPARAITCTFDTISGLAFGDYNVFSSTPLETSGSIRYSCDTDTGSETIVIQIDRGSSSAFMPRTLRSGGATLEYNLYVDPARLSVWGDNASGTSQYGPIAPPDNELVTVPVYGRIEALQNARVGSYTDTVVVTIVF